MDEDEAFAGEFNPWVLSAYFSYSFLLLLKLLLNILLISISRFRTKTVANPEDLRHMSKEQQKQYKVDSAENSPLLTRVLRMQSNDLENIIPFFILGFLFCMSWYAPYPRAVWHFRVFFASRMLHSFCHYFEIQPLRSVFFLIAMGTNVSLAGHVFYKAGLGLSLYL